MEPSSRKAKHRRQRTMVQAAVFGVVVTCFLASAGVIVRSAPQQQQKSLRVLFVGNSYTYYNNLPEMLEQLSASAGSETRIDARMVVMGGATLEHHWQTGQALWSIQHGGWDYVVLQEQSALGPSLMVDGLPRIRAPDNFFKYARMFDEATREAGAKTIFYSTWARRGAPEQDQQALDYAYMQIARELKAGVAPVGMAWESSLKQNSSVELYWQDGSHPSPAGTYLAACVFYATLTGKSPNALSSEISGHSVDDTGRINSDKQVRLVGLSAPNARLIQQTAWKAHQELVVAGGYLKVLAPRELVRPALPVGHKPEPNDLEGLWKGETRVFPRDMSWPAKLELRLSRIGEDWQGELRITLGGRQDDMVSPVTHFRLTETGITFIQGQGVKAGVVKYEGVFTGKSLEGEAQIVLKSGAVVAMGRWSLKRYK